jgi:hypothetical protein
MGFVNTRKSVTRILFILKQKLHTGKVAVGFQVLLLGPAHQRQSRHGERHIRHSDFAPQESRAGNRMLAQEADASLAHVLDPAKHGRLGFVVRLKRKNFMGLDVQDLGKSGMNSAVRFQGAFHGAVIITQTGRKVNWSNGLVHGDGRQLVPNVFPESNQSVTAVVRSCPPRVPRFRSGWRHPSSPSPAAGKLSRCWD